MSRFAKILTVIGSILGNSPSSPYLPSHVPELLYKPTTPDEANTVSKLEREKHRAM